MIKKLKVYIFLFLFNFISLHSFAQEEKIGFVESSNGGITSACKLGFMQRDEYSNLLFVGAITFYHDSSPKESLKSLKTHYALRLGVFGKDLKPEKINYAYLKTKNCWLKRDNKISADLHDIVYGKNLDDCHSSVGKEFFIYKEEDYKFNNWYYYHLSDPFQNINKDVGEIEIGFNSEDGEQDKKIILDFKGKNAEKADEFSGCVKKLRKIALKSNKNNLN